jgi:hypothetical protein
MRQDGITLRPATVADVPALARLRAANTEAHLALDPQTYRVPSPEAVIRHFTAVRHDGPGRDAVLVAEECGLVRELRR